MVNEMDQEIRGRQRDRGQSNIERKTPLKQFQQSRFYLHRLQYSPTPQSAPDEQAKGSKGKKNESIFHAFEERSRISDQSHRGEHLIMKGKLTDRWRFPKMSIVKKKTETEKYVLQIFRIHGLAMDFDEKKKFQRQTTL